jgi:transposase
MAEVTIHVDVPEGITIAGYERLGEGHGFEVTWPLPEHCRCARCGQEEEARIEYKARVQVVRDLDVWSQPSFWVYQPPFHRCSWCNYRQDLIPPFKRKDVAYTYRFERHVLRHLIGSNEEEVARRLGIAAETVARIISNQLTEAKTIDPQRVIRHVGIDELSLKKRHKLYVTILTDLTDEEHPEVLAVVKGRDEAAGRQALGHLTPAQREQVETYRVDMGAAYNAACAGLLTKAQPVIDRFHVAKKFNEAIDAWRKKNHAGLQGETVQNPAQGVSLTDVGISP